MPSAESDLEKHSLMFSVRGIPAPTKLLGGPRALSSKHADGITDGPHPHTRCVAVKPRTERPYLRSTCKADVMPRFRQVPG